MKKHVFSYMNTNKPVFTKVSIGLFVFISSSKLFHVEHIVSKTPVLTRYGIDLFITTISQIRTNLMAQN